MRHLFYLATIILFLFSPALLAQETELHLPHFYQEEPDDPYIPTDRSKQARTPAYTYQQSNIFTVQVNIDENGQNIGNDAANEPSLAIDPTNPNRMAIGWRQFDDITNNFRQAGYAYTEDGGISWIFPGVIEPSGKVLHTLVDEQQSAGKYNIKLNNHLPAGMYYCRLRQNNNIIAIKKLVIYS